MARSSLRDVAFPCVTRSSTFILYLLLRACDTSTIGFLQAQDAEYAADFSALVAASHASELPAGLSSTCKGQGAAPSLLPEVQLASGLMMGATAAQQTCGSTNTCIVPAGTTLRMDSNLDVAALIIRGTLIWDDETQAAAEQWLCAGYVAAEEGAEMNVSVSNGAAYIFIKANGAAHQDLGARALGGVRANMWLAGRPLRRTWSLLAESAMAAATSITLLHDPVAMGWRVGDRLMLAPTTSRSSGTADAVVIAGYGAGNTVRLSSALVAAYAAEFRAAGAGHGAPLSAEVINLSRNLLITGDDLSLVNPCVASSTAATCTYGLHTALMYGGSMSVEYARVEKCGQRGIGARYCMHLHLLGACPGCVLRGNAVEHSHQRGIVVHGTHGALVAENVLADVRGAGIYLEDGNEMVNRIVHNVVICPWAREGSMRGCTVPGTDNVEADTSLNQVALAATL